MTSFLSLEGQTVFVRRSAQIKIVVDQLWAVRDWVLFRISSPNQSLPKDDVVCITKTVIATYIKHQT